MEKFVEIDLDAVM